MIQVVLLSLLVSTLFSINDDNFWGCYSKSGKKYYYSTDQVMLFPASKVCRSYSGNIIVRKGYSWVVKNGSVVSADGTSLNDYAKVKTVDDNTVYVPGVGYKTNWDILKDILNDRVTTDAEEDAWNTRYNLDNDNKDDKEKKKKDNEKDKLPVAIPIVFPNKKTGFYRERH